MSSIPQPDLFAPPAGPVAALPELERLVDAVVDAERELELIRERRELAMAAVADTGPLERAKQRVVDARAAFEDYVKQRVGMPI